MTNEQIAILLKRLVDLEKKLERLSTLEAGKIYLATSNVFRIVDDATVRAAGYGTNIQVSGLNTIGGQLPSKIRGIWYTWTIFSNEADLSVNASLTSADFSNFPTTLSGKGHSAGSLTAGGFTTLSSTGAIKIKINTAITRHVLDVYGYLI